MRFSVPRRRSVGDEVCHIADGRTSYLAAIGPGDHRPDRVTVSVSTVAVVADGSIGSYRSNDPQSLAQSSFRLSLIHI